MQETVDASPQQQTRPAASRRILPWILVGSIAVTVTATYLVWRVVNDRKQADAARIWAETFEEIEIGMTPEQVQSIVRVERKLPGNPRTSRIRFTDGAFLVVRKNKYGHAIDVLFSADGCVEQKRKEGFE